MLLYIDPGTGSALFSIIIGLLTTMYFVIRALIIRFKFTLTGKKSNVSTNTERYVIYCEGPQYISVFLPVLHAFEKKKIPVKYLTSVKEDQVFTENYEYVKAEFIGTGNSAIARLNFINATICLMTTPGLNVYQLKRSKGVKHYSHILHAPSDATLYKMFGLDYFDSVLLSGDFAKKDIQLLETMRSLPNKELVTVGCTYLDVLQNKYNQAKKLVSNSTKKFTVLVSPSWGKNALLSRYNTSLLDPLINCNFHVIIRPHPQSRISEKVVLEMLEKKYESYSNVEWDYHKDNTTSIAKSDIMISDFSGIIFDYVFLHDKPFLYAANDFDFRPYDAGDLLDLRPSVMPWQFKILPLIGKALESKDFSNIETIVKTMVDNTELAENRRKAKNEAWMYEGKAGENIMNYMILKAQEISD